MPLTVQLFVLQLRHTLLAGSLVLLSMGPLAVHAAVLDEAAGRAVLQLHCVAELHAAVGAALSFTVPLDSLPQLAQPNPSLRLNCHSFRMAERREGSTPIWDGRSHVFLYAGCLAPCLSQYEYESARVARRLIGA